MDNDNSIKKVKQLSTSPVAIYFKNLQKYRSDFFTYEEIVVFEFFLVLCKSSGNNFYFQGKRMPKATHLKPYSIREAIKKLIEKGIVEITKGIRGRNHYFLNFDRIKLLISYIYDLSKHSETDLNDFFNGFPCNGKKAA